MLKSIQSKLIFVFAVIGSLAAIIALLPHWGYDTVLRGAFYYSSDFLAASILNATPLEVKQFVLFEVLDTLIVVPLYTLCLFIVFDLVMHNFRISPFKGLVFVPALMDIPENLIFITNLLFFKSAPILTHLAAVFTFFKWTIGFLLILILIIFLFAKLAGVRGRIKIISYDDLWSNPKNVRTYFTWIIGHVLTTVVSILFIVVYMLGHEVYPVFSLKWGASALVFALIYDFIFNLFLKIPGHIFDKAYNHWLRAVFITANAVFFMFALTLLL